MRELNGAYREYGDALRDGGDITPFLRRLCELFQYGKLEKTVLFFIKQRAAYADKEPDLCVDTEREEHHTARIFETLLLRGDCYSVCAERWEKENPVRTIARILGNTIAVYRFLYASFRNPREHIQWWTNVGAVNRDGTFRQLATEILKYAVLSDLHGVYLEGAYFGAIDLRGADLRRARLRGANLEDAILYRANLRHANLRRARLIKADLEEAVLEGANFGGADLSDTDLRRAHLEVTNLQGADLYGANLEGAHLYGANLQRAHLYGANLQGADLQDAILDNADLRRAKGYNLEGAIGTPITD